MSFLQCTQVVSAMSEFRYPWFFIGGWALDLFIGKETRPHDDIEISIFRENQMEVKNHLQDWDLYKVRKGRLFPWENKNLNSPFNNILASHPGKKVSIDIWFSEKEGQNWIYGLNPVITSYVESIYSQTDYGIPYLNPEVVLLYKSNNSRQKDHSDFRMIQSMLSKEKKSWLKSALIVTNPEHEWINLL